MVVPKTWSDVIAWKWIGVIVWGSLAATGRKLLTLTLQLRRPWKPYNDWCSINSRPLTSADKNPPCLFAPLHQTSQIRPILSEPMFSKLMFVILSCSCGTVVDHKPLNQEVASLILASKNFKVVPNKGAILLIFSEKWMPSSSSWEETR